MTFGLAARVCALAAILTALAAPASADVSDFYGVWANGEADGSGIARIVVTPGDGARVVIHLFGQCSPQACDWGTEPARTYAGDPASKEVHSIAADFTTGFARKRIILFPAVGRALRFEVQTDFTDGSGRSDYVMAGNLTYAGDWNAAPRVAATPAAPGGAPAAVADTAPSTGWLGGGGFVGLGATLPAGYVPAQGEDCTPFNPEGTHAANVEGDWRLVDFSHRLLNFGPHRAAAATAQAVVAFYHFDEQCFVGRFDGAMLYWKRAGQVPRTAMAGQDCVALDPMAAKAAAADGDWKVVDGGAVLLDYGDDKDAAARAVSVIRTYKLNRQCFIARAQSTAQYWLSQ